MSPRRLTLAALIFVLAVAAMALSAAVADPIDGASPLTQNRDGASGLQAGRVDPSAVRLSGDERRDLVSQRSLKQRLVLLAVVAALLLTPVLRRRRAVELTYAARSQTSWWSPRFGRAPPASQLLIA